MAMTDVPEPVFDVLEELFGEQAVMVYASPEEYGLSRDPRVLIYETHDVTGRSTWYVDLPCWSPPAVVDAGTRARVESVLAANGVECGPPLPAS
jgi:hypothetical protein